MNSSFGKIEKTCYEYCCWRCGYFWITNEYCGNGIRCPNCNSGNTASHPMARRDLKELKEINKVKE